MRATHAFLVVALGLSAAACGDQGKNAQKKIREEHVPRATEILRDDLLRHGAGVREAASRLAPGFLVEDAATRERQLRYALRYVQEPPRGVPEFIASPMSFLAAVGMDGVVVCRDGREADDHMKGENYGERYAIVRRALDEGRSDRELVEFPPAEEGGEPGVGMIFVHPSVKDGQRVGAVVAGIPLWREAQRVGRQMQVDHADENGLILWSYMVRGDRVFHFGTPEGVDGEMTTGAVNAEARATGLERSPGGYTGSVEILGRWFAYGVVPTPSWGEDVGIVLWRSDPI
jgi:hypothetical protein